MAYSIKRRKFRLINREIQVGLAWRMMIAYLLFLLVGISIMFAPSVVLLISGGRAEEMMPAAREFMVLHDRIWPAVVVMLAGIFIYTIYFSQRIAGPIFRINAAIKKILAGECPENVTLREGDYFVETASLLQDLSRKLSEEKKKETTFVR